MVQGPGSWRLKYYSYRIRVYHASTQMIEVGLSESHSLLNCIVCKCVPHAPRAHMGSALPDI